MPNVSELARHEVELLHRELIIRKAEYANLTRSKAAREISLRRIREIEAELDLPSNQREPEHNHRPAKPAEGRVLTLAQLRTASNVLRMPDGLSYGDVGAIIFALLKDSDNNLSARVLKKLHIDV